jgi:general secretion pathway protein E
MVQNSAAPELRGELRQYLQRQGYEVSEDADLVGKSGIRHSFDMVAEKDDGLSTLRVAVGIAAGCEPKAQPGVIFDLANRAFDTGITSRLLVAVPGFEEVSKQLASKQRIVVIDRETIGSALAVKEKDLLESLPPLRFGTPAELAESLRERGYRVQEGGRLHGRSGVIYSFDVLARRDGDQVNHILAVDFIHSATGVGLAEVALYDAKAYDCEVDGRVMVVSPTLAPEARQFALHQRIRVLVHDDRIPILRAAPTSGIPETKPADKKDEAKLGGKYLRQMITADALGLIPEVMARRHNAVPISVAGNTLQVAMADTSDIFALEAFASQTKMRIIPVPADAREVREAIDFSYKGYGEIEKTISRISFTEESAEDGPGVSATLDSPLTQALSLMIEEAVKARASDIHIEPEDDRLRIRYRIDGILQDMMSLPLGLRRSLISRIKILSNLNIAERQRPQDGQFTVVAKGRDIDIRVAVAPTVWGEMCVLRILDKSLAVIELSELGMMDSGLAKYKEMLKVPHGMILISGPTGAGKTTTLYGSVNSLDKLGRNIVTIEDPAEYRFKDINQIQVNNQAGITFASGLRSILRLDPDVILVGEIRDGETANIAVQAALTGHLMLTSIHANDTVGVLSRMLDLNIEKFLIASCMIGIVAQRMVRRICPDCAQLIEAPPLERLSYEQEIGETQSRFLYGTGCRSCSFTGYLGRTGIFEILTMTDAIRMQITGGASSAEIRQLATKEGMVSLMKDGMRKVKAGITTPSEVIRSAYTMG